MVKMKTRPVCLFIMDGYGLNPDKKGNAIEIANEGVVKNLMAKYPSATLGASGLCVGLPDGQMGNSEVGHLNMGAGRIVYQDLTRITKDIEDGDFFENEELIKAMDAAKNNGKKLHLFGLLSSGGVHSHITHLFALLEMAKRRGLKEVYVHAFMDGRDVPPTSGIDFVKELDDEIKKIGVGKIATVSGRYYAMDRDNRWERVVKAYEALTLGNGVMANSSEEAVENRYKNEVTDEFIVPANIYENGKPVGLVEKGDSVIFFNFRPDRAREITRTIVDEDFNGFAREYFKTYYVCMTQYDALMPNVDVAFKPQKLVNTYGEYISKLGKKQLRIAETEKYAHVTFFFNGGVEATYDGEDRILVPSPKVATYDLKPEMSAYEVCDKVVEAIESGKYDSIILNFANCDMVGHTGVFEAAEKAVEAVDECVGRVADAVKKMDGVMLITADHGNAEQMIDPADGSVFTAHTTNVVPLVVMGCGNIKLKEGRLADLTPTMLDIAGIEKPAEMTGESLIEK